MSRRQQPTHGEALTMQHPVSWSDHPTERYPNGRPVQVATMGPVEGRWCGHCGFPVVGDDAALAEHAGVCPRRV